MSKIYNLTSRNENKATINFNTVNNEDSKEKKFVKNEFLNSNVKINNVIGKVASSTNVNRVSLNEKKKASNLSEYQTNSLITGKNKKSSNISYTKNLSNKSFGTKMIDFKKTSLLKQQK